MVLITAFINLLIVSIPEELFVVTMYLVLMYWKSEGVEQQYNALQLNKENLIKIIIPVIVPAAISNIMRYFMNENSNYILLVFIITMFFAIVYSYKITGYKLLVKTALCINFSILAHLIVEFPVSVK